MGDHALPHHIEEEIYQSRLQIVLLSPTLLQFLSRCPTLPIGRLLHERQLLMFGRASVESHCFLGFHLLLWVPQPEKKQAKRLITNSGKRKIFDVALSHEFAIVGINFGTKFTNKMLLYVMRSII